MLYNPGMTVAHGVDHYENFPVASWLCPARLRPCIAAIYWFARTADDIADEGDAPAHARLADLAAYRQDLLACAAGQAVSPRWHCVFTALGKHIAMHQLPLHLLDDLLKAFEQDVRHTAAGHWYATEAELLAYCRLSANPVGRLLLHLYGVHDATALEESDAVCSALQLINFWQDVGRDAGQQRYYLPLDLMAQCGIHPQDITALHDTPSTIKLIAACTYSARATMLKSIPLPEQIRQQMTGLDGWRASMELRCVVQGGLRILEKIRNLDYQTITQRPHLNALDACLIVWRALWMRG